MRFGVFYELQLPRPWQPGDEQRLFHEALDQVVLADRLGFDYAWEVEHHFLDEYSHASAPEVFLAAAAARTKDIRIGHGIRQVIPNYNHPARSAEGIATLDIIANGRVDFGIGEGATRLELGGFKIPAREKRAMCLEAAEQVANMMVLEPYPGYEGQYFSMPCRNVLPKPVQKPHPPMWIACTNRDTIKVAAKNGLGALAFSFIDPEEARAWSQIYYDIIRSEECVPLGHSVNANLAMVSNFSVHKDRAEAIRRGHEGFEFFRYALNALVAHDTVPGRTNLWGEYLTLRGNRTEEIVVFMQQAGRNKHQHICESLELFASDVMPHFKTEVAGREAKKAAELAPYVAAALARKKWMKPLAEGEVPVVKASVARAQTSATSRQPAA
jgi:alkanesulfonate monooxygenase SsuD/methylene tetrahydromethanopterin reductase-like flavin-dependent oxidoreductase (luciferase family)